METFIQFYENLPYPERRKLKREICKICDIAEATFSRKKSKTDSPVFTGLEKQAITNHINYEYDKHFNQDIFFNYKTAINKIV